MRGAKRLPNALLVAETILRMLLGGEALAQIYREIDPMMKGWKDRSQRVTEESLKNHAKSHLNYRDGWIRRDWERQALAHGIDLDAAEERVSTVHGVVQMVVRVGTERVAAGAVEVSPEVLLSYAKFLHQLTQEDLHRGQARQPPGAQARPGADRASRTRPPASRSSTRPRCAIPTSAYSSDGSVVVRIEVTSGTSPRVNEIALEESRRLPAAHSSCPRQATRWDSTWAGAGTPCRSANRRASPLPRSSSGNLPSERLLVVGGRHSLQARARQMTEPSM
jgi:hypothetical protein